MVLNILIDEIIRHCKNDLKDEVKLRNILYELLSKYDFRVVTVGKTHPDTREKTNLFLMAKKIEGLSDHTLKNYRKTLNDFGSHIQKPVSDITTLDIRNWLADHPNIKISTLRYYVSVLKSFFDHLINEGTINIDPTRKIKNPKLPKRVPKALNLDELEILREGCITLREKALLEVFYATGCRLAEVRNLNWSDINWSEKSLSVIGKGNKERIVFINSRAVFALKKYLKTRNDKDRALFVTEKGKPRRLSERSIQYIFKKISTRVTIEKNIHPHVMRHSFATTMMNHGARIEDLQGLLGHSSPNTTQGYAQVNLQRRKEAYLRSFR